MQFNGGTGMNNIVLLSILITSILISTTVCYEYRLDTYHIISQKAHEDTIKSFIENTKKQLKKDIITPTINSIRNTPKTKERKSIIISAAGDCTLGTDESFGYAGTFMHEFDKNDKDYGYFFKNVKSIFEKDDLTIVNLETTLTTATKKAKKKFRFKGYPEFTKILKLGSVEVVNIANNHIYDYLEKGYEDTTENLKKDEIGYCGYENIYITEIKGVKIGLLGYEGWISSNLLKNKIKKDILDLRKSGVSIIIVSFHWGYERHNYPNPIQKDLGRYCIDTGADLVLGHHPHVMQGIENYKGKHIVYSLGNFCFGGNRGTSPNYDKDTFIFQQEFILEGTKIQNSKVQIIPCSISSVTNRNNYQPTPLIDVSKNRVIDRLNKYSKDMKFYIEQN